MYVESEYPPKSKDTEKGLHRIGAWDDEHRVVMGRPLVNDGASIAHVALVYSGDEEHVSDPAAGFVVAVQGVGGVIHYASAEGLVKTFGNDMRGLFHRKTPPRMPSEASAAELAGSHAWTALVDHVGGYVARNVLRERVRVFVRDAITRLAARPDIRSIVINSHSNGTVIAFDVIPRIWPLEAGKLCLFVPAGSPLRKYVYLLSWGHEVENWPSVRWLNFYDIDDGVADQLQPEFDKRMTGASGIGGSGPFATYAFNARPIAVEDRLVSNVDASKNAHNYWANPKFCEILATEIMACQLGAGTAPEDDRQKRNPE